MRIVIAFVLALGLYAQDHAPGRILAKPKDTADPSEVHATIVGQGARIGRNIPGINVLVIHAAEPARERVKAALANSGLFEYVEDDPVGKSEAVVPNDTSSANQLWIRNHSFDSPTDGLGAWDITTGNVGVSIGVIDSGIAATHPDLGSKVLAGWDFLTLTAVPVGVNSDTGCNTGHGTAVAGTIAASTNNALGIAGAAWLSPVIPLVVTSAACFAYWSDVASAIIWATDHGAKVLNISIFGTQSSTTLEQGTMYGYNHGVSIIAAAGNNGSTTCGYPACAPGVIASVGAIDSNNVLWPESNRGAAATVYADGCCSTIYTTQMNGTYGYWQGTSFASPLVAGAVALAVAAQPILTPAQVKTLIANYSDPIAAGLKLNARRLVAAAKDFIQPGDTTPPTATITSPINGSRVGRNVTVTANATDDIALKSITLLVDSVTLCTNAVAGNSASVTCNWNTRKATVGNHLITATAMDTSGNTGTASITVVK